MKLVIWKQLQLLFQIIQTEFSRSSQQFTPGFLNLSTTGILGWIASLASTHWIPVVLPPDCETQQCLQTLLRVPTRQTRPGLRTTGVEPASVLILTVQRVLKSKS